SKISIVSPKAQTTRTRILGVHTTEDAQLVFLDTPGFIAKEHRGALAQYLNDALSTAASEVDVNVLVFDAARAANEPALVERLRDSVTTKRLAQPGIVVLNKIDLIPRELLLPLIERLAAAFAGSDSPDFIPVSAKTGEGAERLIETLCKRLPEGPPYFPADALTDQPERFLAAEIIREKLFRQLNQELPYSTAVQIERWEEDERLLRLQAVILVERVSQRGIVIGKGGQKIKAIGTAARLELERVFELPVHLELYVRVEEDWTKTARGLERAGYRKDGYSL
ncbi:MAG: GTPase Era, partial [Bdellovibrionales bacterium]|nr:GTPase Era [Bdellovibrionales bacterium]